MNPSSDSTNQGDQKFLRKHVVTVGAGIGGICAAVAAARGGADTLLLEAAPEIGGTGVHSPVGLVCTFFDSAGRFVNRGIHEELCPELYTPACLTDCQAYDEVALYAAYHRLIKAEPNLTVLTSAPATRVETKDGRITAVITPQGRVEADVFVDATAEGHFAARAGAEFAFGRTCDGRVQPATLTFRVRNVDLSAFGLDTSQPDWRRWANIEQMWGALGPAFSALKSRGGTSNPRDGVLAIPDASGTSLLFNQTRIGAVDPRSPESMEAAMAEGRKQVNEFWDAVKEHSAFRNSPPIEISPRLGVREGRRILGDYVLTVEDCLGEARFDDMVAAGAYAVDIHDPEGKSGTVMKRIPGSGYYHIPYRCLRARGFSNLLLGSRCISGTHEAHASYRIIATVSAIGQAAGTAAALAATGTGGDIRAIDVGEIQRALAEQNQFVETTSCAQVAELV